MKTPVIIEGHAVATCTKCKGQVKISFKTDSLPEISNTINKSWDHENKMCRRCAGETAYEVEVVVDDAAESISFRMVPTTPKSHE